MKKQFLILLSLIFLLLGSEQILFGQEEKLSILNKLSAKYSEDKVFLELIGSFYNISGQNIQTNFTGEKGVITVEKVLLDTNIAYDTASGDILNQTGEVLNQVTVTLPQILEIKNIGVVEQSGQTQLTLQYEKLSFSNDFLITENKITFFFDVNIKTPRQKNVSSIEKQPDFLVSKLYVKPSRLNITFLHKESTKRKAYKLSQKLLRQKIKVEKDLDIDLNIVNITKIPLEDFGRNVIYFRENHYLSAIYLSDILKDVYVVMPFIHPERKKDIDLEILIIE